VKITHLDEVICQFLIYDLNNNEYQDDVIEQGSSSLWQKSPNGGFFLYIAKSISLNEVVFKW